MIVAVELLADEPVQQSRVEHRAERVDRQHHQGRADQDGPGGAVPVEIEHGLEDLEQAEHDERAERDPPEVAPIGPQDALKDVADANPDVSVECYRTAPASRRAVISSAANPHSPNT